MCMCVCLSICMHMCVQKCMCVETRGPFALHRAGFLVVCTLSLSVLLLPWTEFRSTYSRLLHQPFHFALGQQCELQS